MFLTAFLIALGSFALGMLALNASSSEPGDRITGVAICEVVDSILRNL